MLKVVMSVFLGCAYGVLAQGPPRVLVSTAWLGEHLKDPDLVVLHVAMLHEGSPKTLIAGARVLDYHAVTEDRGDLPVEMPAVETLTRVLEEAGVGNDRRVVLYGEGVPHLVARVFVTLDYLGHGDRTSVLDGGLEAWKAEGRPVASQPSAATRAKFVPHVRSEMLVSADWIAARLNDPSVTLIDARPANEYTGEATPGGGRGGHIPGAYNLYFQDLVVSKDNPCLKELDYVKGRFDEAGAKKTSTVVSYCYIGMRASYTYMVSRHLGYDAKFYDPSWAEWSKRGDLPVTRGDSRR